MRTCRSSSAIGGTIRPVTQAVCATTSPIASAPPCNSSPTASPSTPHRISASASKRAAQPVTFDYSLAAEPRELIVRVYYGEEMGEIPLTRHAAVGRAFRVRVARAPHQPSRCAGRTGTHTDGLAATPRSWSPPATYDRRHVGRADDSGG